MLRAIGVYPRLARGVSEASRLYGKIDMSQYVEMLGDVLRFVMSQKDLDDMLEDEGGDLRYQVRELILAVADGEDILWADVLKEAESRNMDAELVKDEIDRMVRDGIIFERQIGVRLKIDSDDEFWN